MQNNLFYALNGIATAARAGTYNSGVPDQNAMSACQDAYEQLIRILGTTYDSASSSTSSSTVYLQSPAPFGLPIAGSWDSQENLGITNIKLVGG